VAAAAVLTARQRPLPPAVRRRRVLVAIGNHALLIALGAMFAVPIVFILLTALMTDEQALSPDLWPKPFQWNNFVEVWHRVPLLRYTWNTFQIAFLLTAGTVVSSIPVAYALSRMRWRGREGVFVLVLATIMLPNVVTLIPVYIVFSKLGWIPSFKPLVVPAFFATDAFSIFLLRQFFLTIPKELSDAARVDGAGELQILLRIIVPLAKPAISAVALFSFLYAWNDFFMPLLYLGQDPHLWTLGIGLSEFRGLHHVEWNLTMAASILFIVPVIFVFILSQRAFMEGIKLGVGK
jgi:multiple sugar transport system permease protein